jgi:acetyl-CoA C-acetyltransferase
MVNAIQQAAKDAGSEMLVQQLESIAVLQGMWEYRNPGKLIADTLGCSQAKSILADLGNLQLSPLFELCIAIEAGEQHIGVVVGGEAKYRELRAKITGQAVSNTKEPDNFPAPDTYKAIPDPFASDVEINAGIMMPVELFAVIESALRYSQGLTIEEHRNKIAALYSEFSKVAASNPHAWSREVFPAEEIRDAVGKNAMLAFPYTKKHNSQWNVNQAAAIMVCSAAKAIELGLSNSRWIYPVAATQSRHVVCLGQKYALHSHPGSVIAGQRAYALAGITPNQVNVADVYSCFPSAVQSFAQDLQLDGVCPWSVSGSMAFAGGPYNHAALNSVVSMVGVLREKNTDQQQIGLVSNLSGIFGKEGIALFSNQPNVNGFCFDDVTERVAEVDKPLPTDTQYTGPATVVGYTVVYNKESPSHAFAYCDTPSGARTVARSIDKTLMEKMTQEEFVGRKITVHDDKSFSEVE